MTIRVMVTAIGGDLGQSIVKALRLSKESVICYGCDMNAGGVGSAFVEGSYLVPPALAPDYPYELGEACKTAGVDAIIPASDPEIWRLARWGSVSDLPVVCQKIGWLSTYGDKLECMRGLSGHVDLAPFADGEDWQAVEKLAQKAGFPVVVKGSRSSGSRSLRVEDDFISLHAAIQQTNFPLVQAYISGAEYSVGVFVCDQFTSAIAFKRVLGPVGCSWYAVTSQDEEVLDYALQVATVSGLRGAANIQVRKSPEGVRLLEVNPRFSSLVAARALCGFRDAEWSLAQALHRPLVAPDPPYQRIHFHRFFHEVVDIGFGYRAIEEWSPRIWSTGG